MATASPPPPLSMAITSEDGDNNVETPFNRNATMILHDDISLPSPSPSPFDISSSQSLLQSQSQSQSQPSQPPPQSQSQSPQPPSQSQLLSPQHQPIAQTQSLTPSQPLQSQSSQSSRSRSPSQSQSYSYSQLLSPQQLQPSASPGSQHHQRHQSSQMLPSPLPNNICTDVQQMIMNIAKKEVCETQNEFLDLKNELKIKLQKLKKIEDLSQAFLQIPKLQNELPKDNNHGYMNYDASFAVLQELSFISKQSHSFGLLLLQCDGTNKVLDELGPEYANEFVRQVADRIGDLLSIQHTAFLLHKSKLAVLCYITDERLLSKIGKEIIQIITEIEFEVGSRQWSTKVAIGSSIWESDNLKFDFRKWITHAEIGLNKAIAYGWNCCVLSKGEEADLGNLNAVGLMVSSTGINSSNDSQSQSQSHKHQSTLSRFATLSLSQGNILMGQQGNIGLTTEQIQQSLQLHDKLQRLKNGDEDGFIALSLVRSYITGGAHYNFQNNTNNGNTLLMLSIIKPLPIVLLYLCKKVYSDVNFDLPNADGNTALMLAIDCNLSDDLIQLILSRTKDKNAENKNNKTVLALAREKQRENVIRWLSE